jgi:solute carrier family 25 (mitochondrial carnitine/acylcarnitine transporter), member 20/29
MLLQGQSSDTTAVLTNTHTWLASAFAGGCAGSLTWALVYPVDVIKSQIQTAPLDTPLRDLRMWTVGQSIVSKHGYRYLFRGLGITLVRAFPVNGTIFPVYEFTLRQVSNWGV